MKNLIKQDSWYQKLIIDIKKLEFTGVVATKWFIGKRLIKDELKFQKTKYGDKRIENIAKDVGMSSPEVYKCIQFAKKYKTIDELKNKSWRDIVRNYLPTARPKLLTTPELPKGKYNCIYADPSWQYYIGGEKNQQQHYDTMSIQDICDLPVQDIAADDCILFLWATSPIMDKAFEVIKEWGFDFSTIGFVWVKSKNDRTGFAFGCGYWTRANAEYLLIATKGHIERKDASISQIIYEPKREHSRKPDIVREKIVQLVGDLPRIELFARGKAPKGWQNWGYEVVKSDTGAKEQQDD